MSGTAQQVAPRGMQRIPFPLESYPHESLPLSLKRLVNLYAEAQPADARTQAALLPTPGLTPQITVGSGPIKAMNGDVSGFIYVVSGDHFYRVREVPGGPFVDDLGFVGVPSIAGIPSYALIPTIACCPNAVVVCIPPNAFTCDHVGALNPLGGTFPGNATSVAYLDGYFAFTSSQPLDTWFVSHLLDPTMFNALDFATAEAMPNALNRIIAHAGNFWLMGSAGIEIWYDAGQADFPFRRISGGVIPSPSVAPASIAQGDVELSGYSLFWVNGWDMAFRSQGYQAKRISTNAIEQIIRNEGNFAQIQSGFCYTQDGHVFYCINFPDRTLVYDAATDKWHDRASSVDGTGRWRPNAAAAVADAPFLGDYQTGQTYYADPRISTDNGVNVVRQMTMPPLWATTRRAFCSRLEVEMEMGVVNGPGADLLLQWSDDGGLTWNAGRSMPLLTGKRSVTTRLGSFRQRTFRLTGHGHQTFYAVDADIVPGAT